MPNILIVAHGEHGKDTFAEFLNHHNPKLTFTSSSWTCAETVVYPLLKDKYGYTSVEECYEDRRNHRAEWFELIKAYNIPDKTKLVKLILSRASMYVGLRNPEEYEEAVKQDLFDYVFWIDASERKPLESKESFGIEFDPDTMIYIDNNGVEAQLEMQAIYWAEKL